MELNKFTVFDCSIIHFPKIQNRAGNITPIQNNIESPFAIKRVYYLYDVPGGESRGAHAHKELEQLIIAASGSFDVVLFDGKEEKKYTLNRSYYGLYVPKMLWRSMENFSTNALAFVASDSLYDEKDYIREKELFIEEVNGFKI